MIDIIKSENPKELQPFVEPYWMVRNIISSHF